MTADRAALRAADLTAGYATRRAQQTVLAGLNLTVRRGELICLLGPNGVGKSTLLRTLASIQPLMAGSIQVDGIDIRKLGPIDLAQRIGVVLTERTEIASLPAYRIVELGRYPYLGWSGTLGELDHRVVRWALEVVGALHLATRDINKLSDGELQRVMIARALAQEPVLLLLDEPTAFLDVPSRVELMGLLRHLVREEHLAVVVSTHDLDLALRAADTVWLVSPGGRFDVGAPEDLILAGRFSEAFPSTRIHFIPEERAFRLLPGRKGKASVHGVGLEAVLARAVLEREGYEIGASASIQVTVNPSSKWSAVAAERQGSGETFAQLAEFVRNLSDNRVG